MGANLIKVLEEKDELFMTGRYKIITDCVREWVILLFGFSVIVYFSICARRIYKTNNGVLTFDVVMLLIEAAKVGE
jgi:hypothetical protein